MNVLLWNCRGVLNLCFQCVLTNLVNAQSLTLVIVTETQVGGDRAKQITNRFPFDGAI